MKRALENERDGLKWQVHGTLMYMAWKVHGMAGAWHGRCMAWQVHGTLATWLLWLAPCLDQVLRHGFCQVKNNNELTPDVRLAMQEKAAVGEGWADGRPHHACIEGWADGRPHHACIELHTPLMSLHSAGTR